MPNAEEWTKFWSDIWGAIIEAEWVKDLKRERERVNDKRPQERVSVSVSKIWKQYAISELASLLCFSAEISRWWCKLHFEP